MTTSVEDRTTPGTVDLAKNSVMLTLRTGKVGNRRRVAKATVASEVEVDADKDAIGVNKELLDSPELAAIARHDRDTRRWLYGRSLPAFGTLREGVYRVPLDLTDEVEDYLQDRQTKRRDLVGRFMPTYEVAVIEAQARLRALFNRQDYPAAAAIEATFFMEWQYMMFGTPDNLSATLFKKERAKAAAVVNQEVDELRQVLRQSFADLMTHAADRLGVGQDGKKVVFRDTMVEGIAEFFQYFGSRNLVGDDELERLVWKAREVMGGVVASDLRDNVTLRTDVQRTFAEIKKTMDDNTMLAPIRRIDTSRLDD